MPFDWTPEREKAALLVAEDRKPDTAIAAECGIGERQLARWKLIPEFIARTNEHRKAIREELQRQLRAELGERTKRALAKQKRHAWIQSKIDRIMEARGNSDLHNEVAGGDTGIVCVKEKWSESGQRYIESKVDTGLLAFLKELDDLERDIAIELGEWKQEPGKEGEENRGGLTINGDVIVLAQIMTPEELQVLKRRYQKLQQQRQAQETTVEVVEMKPLPAPEERK